MNLIARRSFFTLITICVLIFCIGYFIHSRNVAQDSNNPVLDQSFGKSTTSTEKNVTISARNLSRTKDSTPDTSSNILGSDPRISNNRSFPKSTRSETAVNIGKSMDPDERYQEFTNSPTRTVNIGEYIEIDVGPSLKEGTSEVINIGSEREGYETHSASHPLSQLVEIGEPLGDPYGHQATALTSPVNIGPNLYPPTLPSIDNIR